MRSTRAPHLFASLAKTREPACSTPNQSIDWLKEENNVATRSAPVSQCQKPTGWFGRFTLWRMNSSHSKLTDWGLTHISVEKHYTILDVGCGGGRTIGKLAAAATQGKVYRVDYSEESVGASKRTNARSIDIRRVEVRHRSASRLPL